MECSGDELSRINCEKVLACETSYLKQAQVIMASLEECVLRRYNPKPSASLGKGGVILCVIFVNYDQGR